MSYLNVVINNHKIPMSYLNVVQYDTGVTCKDALSERKMKPAAIFLEAGLAFAILTCVALRDHHCEKGMQEVFCNDFWSSQTRRHQWKPT
jgi:hypothetical protein